MSTLSAGAQGAEVEILQGDLAFLGYTVAADGDFGGQTKAALMQFQTDQQMGADGIAGLATWAALDNLVPRGIDISHNNGAINWDNLSPHIQFVYCKSSQGAGFKDPAFGGYITEVNNKQLIGGAYHFLTFQSSAQSQLENFMNCGFDFSKDGTLPPAVDIEWQVGSTNAQTNALNQYIKDNRDTCIALASEFLSLLAAQTNRTPVVYTAKSFMLEFLGNTPAFGSYPLWIPAYQTNPPGLPPGWDKYAIWQYFGAQDGAPGVTDLNIFNGTSADLKVFASVGTGA